MQLAETAKKNEFRAQLGQHASDVASLSGVNKDIITLDHEEKVTEVGNDPRNEDKLPVNILNVINLVFSEQHRLAHGNLCEKGKNCLFKVTFMIKQMVTRVIRKSKVLATREGHKKIGLCENMAKLTENLYGENKNKLRTEEEKIFFFFLLRG